MVKIVIFILFIFIAIPSNGQKVYFKSIDAERANDSVIKYIDKISNLRITFFKSSYWESIIDTTTAPNIYHSHFNFYRDTAGHDYAIIINSYFIYGPISLKIESLEFIKSNWESVFNTKYRPDERDSYIDSAGVKELLKKHPEMPLKTAMDLNLRGVIDPSSSDGIGNELEINIRDSIAKLRFSENKFESDNKWYKFNSKLAIYTLKLLLEKDIRNTLDNFNRGEKHNYDSELIGVEKYNWLISNVNKQIRFAKKYKEELKKQKRKLK